MITAYFNRINPKLVTIPLVFACLKIEFPVVPVTGQPTLFIQYSFSQWIAFVWTTIVARVNSLPGIEQHDLTTLKTEHLSAAALECIAAD
jgi:hypothetical protein